MAITTDEQAQLPPASGLTLFAPGDPLSAHWARDLPLAINNLWARVAIPVAFLPAPTTILCSAGTNNESRELYVTQCPMLIPRGTKRLLWTAGITASSTGSSATTASALTLYVSATPYTGPAGPTAFDASNLAQNYSKHSASIELAVTNATAYELADDSSSGISPVTGCARLGELRYGYAILTVTAQGATDGGSNNQLFLSDFTVWGPKA